MTDRDSPTSADARTVLPGRPVTYHPTAPIGCIAIGTPISPQPDPSQIVGVCDPTAPPEEALSLTDAEVFNEIRDAIRNGECGERSDEECRHMLDWIDRAEAALRRVAAIEENGYDPITDTGAPR